MRFARVQLPSPTPSRGRLRRQHKQVNRPQPQVQTDVVKRDMRPILDVIVLVLALDPERAARSQDTSRLHHAGAIKHHDLGVAHVTRQRSAVAMIVDIVAAMHIGRIEHDDVDAGVTVGQLTKISLGR